MRMVGLEDMRRGRPPGRSPAPPPACAGRRPATCAYEQETIDIAAGVRGLDEQLKHHERLDAARQDFALGNVKARLRMVAQYAIANARGGLVIGTDHAAEAVMGFFTKFGDGACDLAPLAGLVKGQVRALGAHLGAPRASGPQAADRRSRGAAAQAGRTRTRMAFPTPTSMPSCTAGR